jgi:TfoX/Sxy family transcriptional regulator of competence genes
MFSKIGFFKEDKIFGLLGKNTFYLKTDNSTITDFEKHGMMPFTSEVKKKECTTGKSL